MKAVTQKPLLDSHLTVEDFAIWLSLASRFEHLRRPFGRPALLPADRRDAELMLFAQKDFMIVVLTPVDNIYWQIDVRGMDSGL